MLDAILFILIPINLIILTLQIERLKSRVYNLEQPVEQAKPKNPCFYNKPDSVEVIGYQPQGGM